MTKTVLLVVRTPSVSRNVIERLHLPGIRLIDGTSLDDVRRAFAEQPIDHVIFGGGLELDERLEIVREVFAASRTTTVHMNAPLGPESFLPFVQSVLGGFYRSK